MYNSPEKIGNQIRNERMKKKIAIKYISEYSDDILEDIHIRNIPISIFFILACFILREIENKYIRK